MKKLNLSNTGGHPFTSDDIEFLFDSFYEVIKGMLSPYSGITNDNIVLLSGCVITDLGSSFTHTAGFIFYNEEVYYVPAKITPQTKIGSGAFVYNFSSNYLAPGTVTYQNGTTVNTWVDNYAEILWDTSGGVPSNLVIDAPPLYYLIANQIISTNFFASKSIIYSFSFSV